VNNEPVAWRTHYPSGWEYKDGNPPFELKGNSQLLYTHPAKCRCCNGYGLVGNIEDTVDCPVCHGEGFENHPADLTDEEMRKVINENVENVTVAEMVMFLTVCKAILRKAQEK